MSAPAMSVAENIFLGRDYPTRLGLVNWRALNAQARACLAALGVDHISPVTRVSRLSVGDRMLTKIAAAFLDDARAPARLFVMDEPTAALAGEESERLFRVIAELKRRQCGIIYVSHRLDEVLAIADRITVLRDGESRATLTAGEATKSALIEAMTGRGDIEPPAPPMHPGRADVALSVSRLEASGLHDISFEVRAGEILGFVGLAGAGHERLLPAMVGGARSGDVAIGGVTRRLREPADAWRARPGACAPGASRRRTVAYAGHRSQRRAASSSTPLSPRNFSESPRRTVASAGNGRAGAAEIERTRAKDPHSQRRQSAEGDVRARRGGGSPRPAARRAYARGRRRREIRHLRIAARTRGGRCGDRGRFPPITTKFWRSVPISRFSGRVG